MTRMIFILRKTSTDGESARGISVVFMRDMWVAVQQVPSNLRDLLVRLYGGWDSHMILANGWEDLLRR